MIMNDYKKRFSILLMLTVILVIFQSFKRASFEFNCLRMENECPSVHKASVLSFDTIVYGFSRETRITKHISSDEKIQYQINEKKLIKIADSICQKSVPFFDTLVYGCHQTNVRLYRNGSLYSRHDKTTSKVITPIFRCGRLCGVRIYIDSSGMFDMDDFIKQRNLVYEKIGMSPFRLNENLFRGNKEDSITFHSTWNDSEITEMVIANKSSCFSKICIESSLLKPYSREISMAYGINKK